MTTIAEVRKQMVAKLKATAMASPELTVDLLIGLIIGKDRVFVLAHPEYPLDDDARTKLDDLVVRRARGEPLQYLTGEREFYGRSFHVTPDVLIPRPETEFLVETAINLIQKRFSFPVHLADVGTGSGCIAVSVLREVPSAFCCAIDYSFPALRIAEQNARKHGVANRMAMVCGDLLESFAPREYFDLIFSNPPYVARMDYNNLPVEVRDFEPDLALFGGDDGFAIYRRLIPASHYRLKAGGYLLLESGAGQMVEMMRLTAEAGFSVEATIRDLQGILRCLVVRKAARKSHRSMHG